MFSKNKIGIVLQARMGSSRLPNKMNLPFYGEDTILDIIFKNLTKYFSDYPIILATTDNTKDNVLVEKAKEHQVDYFTGDEENVLRRFVDAADLFNLDYVIRVCADNPMLDMYSIQNIIKSIEMNPSYDYVSYYVNNKPAILTHYGFWTEGIKTSSLKKIQKLSEEKIHIEHITSYFYTTDNDFSIFKLTTDPIFSELIQNIRLTIDTESDFNTIKDIYKSFKNEITFNENNTTNLVNKININPVWVNSMELAITQNTK